MYDFTEFRSEEISPAEGSYFFAENREDAEGYGSERYGGHVMEVYLSAENLADYNDQPSEFYQLKDKREQVQWLKERGYDGWYADMDSGGWGEVSVFSPNQIKSATDNIGTFDRGNNDTRYSIEDSGWDAYHRRNQEELESNTAAAERARREERAEERAAAEDEARRMEAYERTVHNRQSRRALRAFAAFVLIFVLFAAAAFIAYKLLFVISDISEAVMTQSSMPTEPLKSEFLSKRNDPLCRLRFAGGIFTVSPPTGRRNIYEHPSDYLSFRF